jgi:predicted hotdog family 3-hydroxylacyl-ACP dehydratase
MLPDKEVLTYIPQRPPIVMIDEIHGSDEQSTITSFVVKEGALFVDEGELKEPGLVENIAQTAAAGVGYQFALKKEAVPEGFIGAVKDLKIERLPRVGEEIRTKVSIMQEVFGVTLIEGVITLNGERIASCEMKIVLNK